MLPGGNVSLDGTTSGLLNLSDMEVLTSAAAADLLGVNAQKFHRLVAAYAVDPVLKAKGIRGVRYWHPLDIEALARRIEADEVAS